MCSATATVVKWLKRPIIIDLRMSPESVLTVLTAKQEAIAVVFRQHTFAGNHCTTLDGDDELLASNNAFKTLSNLTVRARFRRLSREAAFSNFTVTAT